MERWKNGPPQPGTWRPPQNLDEWWNSLSLYPKEQRRATRFINAVNNRADHLRWAERTTLCQVTDKEWIKLWNLGKKSLRTFREDFPYMNELEATVEKASPQNNPNVVWVGDTGLEASENQIIVLQDEYRSGYECPLCKDLKHRTVEGTYGENKKTESIIECDNCQGQGYYVKGLVAETKTKCTHCEGTGWASSGRASDVRRLLP